MELHWQWSHPFIGVGPTLVQIWKNPKHALVSPTSSATCCMCDHEWLIQTNVNLHDIAHYNCMHGNNYVVSEVYRHNNHMFMLVQVS